MDSCLASIGLVRDGPNVDGATAAEGCWLAETENDVGFN